MLNRKRKIYFVTQFSGEEEVVVPVDLLLVYANREDAEAHARIINQRHYEQAKKCGRFPGYESRVIEKEI